ncbi:ABC1 family-domain-containing protein [Scenedesmus sp. NREL 46B-D3]|nr:ABC1 family-domain-containing protein [Scenedesmus sp. NREL 46B-D3]
MQTCGHASINCKGLYSSVPGQQRSSCHIRLRRTLGVAAAVPATYHALPAASYKCSAYTKPAAAQRRFSASRHALNKRRAALLQARATRQQYGSAAAPTALTGDLRAAAAAAAAAEAAAAGPGPPPTAAAAASAAAVAYSATDTADTWNRRPVPVLARLCEISIAFGWWWVRSQLHKDERRAAADMRKVLVDLGPAFVKIGQALSSRPDVLPPPYLAELELLQDRIPPFSDVEALQVIEAELGVPWGTVFSSLSASPVAAASLGQVYKGTLASNGAEVAVKVQRPGVVEAIGRDTFILRNLAAIARRQLKLNTDLPALVDEWAASLFKELDYRREAANAIRFAELFSFMPEVVVPNMYSQFTTPRVLAMQWIEGERLRSASSQQQRPPQVAEDLRLVEIGVRCSLEQMLEEGFYHADPHPGNLLKTKDGKLAYLDFGMMGEVEPNVRQALIRATLNLVNREYERLAEDFVVLGLLPQGTDMNDVLPALTGVFQSALAGGVSNISFSSLSAELGRTMYRYSFRIPPYYTLLVRSLSVLEGIALASDPNYKVLGAAYPWVSRRLLTQDSPELHATLNNLLYDNAGRFQFGRLESLLEQAAKAAQQQQRVSGRGSQAAAAGGPLALVLSPEGRYIRGILEDELAKGLDAAWRLAVDDTLQAASHQLEGVVASLPVPAAFLPPWLQRQPAAADDTMIGSSSSSLADVRQALVETMMSVPKLAAAEDKAQVDGLTRLATQLAAFSTASRQQQQLLQQQQPLQAAVVSSSSSSTLVGSTVPGSRSQQQQQALLQQLQQTAVVLQWLLSEVQLLSPEARREALSIPSTSWQSSPADLRQGLCGQC